MTALSAEDRPDEATLIRRAQAGDSAAWAPIVQAHQQPVFRLAFLILGDADEAEDVTQDTFVRAWRNVRRFDLHRPLRPWLLRIASNLSSNRRRSAARHLGAALRSVRNSEVHAEAADESAARRASQVELMQALHRLDQRDQQVLYLRYFLELPVEESAEVLGMPEGTVKSRSNRALSKLKALMELADLLPAEGREP